MKRLFLFILVFALMGQLSEITYQSVAAGEYIKQYAIVQKVNPSGSYVNGLCTDCSCVLTVRDKTNQALFSQQSMQQIDTGLFGYQLQSSVLTAGQSYMTFANCSSPTYGWGMAIGQLELSSSPSMTQAAATTTPSSNAAQPLFSYQTCGLLEVGCHINNVVTGIRNFNNALLNMRDGLIQAIRDGFSSLKGAAGGGIAGKALSAFTALGASILKMIYDPGAWYSEDFLPLMIRTVQYGLIGLFAPVALLEAFIIGHSLLTVQSARGRSRLFYFITTYANDHILVLKFFMLLAGYVFAAAAAVYQIFIGTFVKVLGAVIPG